MRFFLLLICGSLGACVYANPQEAMDAAERTAQVAEATGGLLNWWIPGAGAVGLGVAALARHWGKVVGVKAVAKPIEEARDRELESKLSKIEGRELIVINKTVVAGLHARRRVSRAIKRATSS